MEYITEIKKVLQRSDGIKMVIIPKQSKLQKGEFVFISNNLDLCNKLKKEDETHGRKGN
jgi:hypothetical protein